MKRILLLAALAALSISPVAAAPGDITLSVPRTQATASVARIEIVPAAPSMRVTFTVGDEAVTVIARNSGPSAGVSYAAGTFTPTAPVVANGFNRAINALRSGANANAGLTALIAQLRTDGLISLTGTVE